MLSKLAENHSRSSDPENSFWSQNTSDLRTTKTVLFSKRNKVQSPRETPNKSGDSEHVGEGSNKNGPSLSRAVPLKYISNTKERFRSISTNHKSKTVKFVHTLSKIQNGNFERSKGHPDRGGLHVQNRSEGCLLLGSIGQGIPKICSVSLAGESLRVPMSHVWSRPSPEDFHKTSKSSYVHFKKTKHTSSDLHRRFNCLGLLKGGNRDGQELSNLPFGNAGVHNKLRKICSDPKQEDRVLGGGGGVILNSVDMTFSVPK